MANLYVEQFNANLKHYQGNFPLALERVIDFYFHDKLFLSKKVKDALLNLKAYLADIRLPNGDFKKPLGQILVQYDFIKPEKSPKRFSFGGLFKSEKPEFPFWAIKKRPENPLAMYSQKKSRLKKLRQKTKKYVLMPKDFMEVFQCAIQIEKSIRQAEANIAKERSKKSISAGLLFKVEVALAREDFSLEAIRSQILGLEKTLEMKSNMTSNDYLKINNNIKNWALVFGEKAREFVFDAPNLDILKKRLDVVYPDEFIRGSVLEHSKNGYMKVIDFLQEEGFFDGYFQQADNGHRYNYVSQFYDRVKSQDKLTPMGVRKTTLLVILNKIITEEYQVVLKKETDLMELPDATVGKVFEALKQWLMDAYFDKRHYRALHKVLLQKINEKEEKFKNWEKISTCIAFYDPKPYRTYQPLMRELHQMQYYGNPNQDPAEKLKEFLAPPHDKKLDQLISQIDNRGKFYTPIEEQDAVIIHAMQKLSVQPNRLAKKLRAP
jgi:hypothetical protein